MSDQPTALVPTEIEPAPLLAPHLQPLPVQEIIRARDSVRALMKGVMLENQHFGTIPGTQRPTLLKPGAQLLCSMFQMAPEYETEREIYTTDEISVLSVCRLKSIATGRFLGAGRGAATSNEPKWKYLNKGGLRCPKCGAEAVVGPTKSGRDPGSFWCKHKDGAKGCGANFSSGSHEADEFKRQKRSAANKVKREDIGEVYNTILKMADKRALIEAVRQVTACGDIFLGDQDDDPADVRESRAQSERRKEGQRPEQGPQPEKEQRPRRRTKVRR